MSTSDFDYYHDENDIDFSFIYTLFGKSLTQFKRLKKFCKFSNYINIFYFSISHIYMTFTRALLNLLCSLQLQVFKVFNYQGSCKKIKKKKNYIINKTKKQEPRELENLPFINFILYIISL